MKNRITLALVCLALSSFVQAQVYPYNIALQQRNATNDAYDTRILPNPAGAADGIIFYNGATSLPGYVTLGTGLSISSGVLSAEATAQVNADWNATSGAAAILNKPTIPAAYTFNFGEPATRSLSMSTAYQASDPTRAAIITPSTTCTASLTLSGGGTCTLQIRTAPTSSLSCSTGTVYATLTNTNTGTLTVGLGLNQRVGSATSINLRAGSYFILCPTSGTFSVDSAVDQSIG